MNHTQHIVMARALRFGLDPRVDADSAARELAELAGRRRWLLKHARARITRRLLERPSDVGERSRALLDRALTVADAHSSRRYLPPPDATIEWSTRS